MKNPDSRSATNIFTLIATIRKTTVFKSDRKKIGSSNR